MVRSFLRNCLVYVLAFAAIRSAAGSCPTTGALVTETSSSRVTQIDFMAGTRAPVAAGLTLPRGVVLKSSGITAYVIHNSYSSAGNFANLATVNLATGNVTPVATLSDWAWGVDLDPAGTRVFATEPDSGRLVAVDLATGAVTTVWEGLSSPRDVAVDDAGAVAYVVGVGELLAVSLGTPPTVVTVSTGLAGGNAVALAPAGDKAYVSGGVGGLVAVNLADGSVTVVSPFPSTEGILALDLDPAGTVAYATTSSISSPPPTGTKLYKIDLATGEKTVVTQQISQPFGIAVAPSGTVAYVTEEYLSRLWAVHLDSGIVEPSDTKMAFPFGIDLSTDGRTAFVTSVMNDYSRLLKIDRVSGTISVLADFPTNSAIMDVRLDPSRAKAVVVSFAGDLYSVDLSTGIPTTIASGLSEARGLSLAPSGATAYVTEASSGEVSAIDLTTGTVTTIATGLDHPFGIALSPTGSTAYVTETYAGRLLQVNLATGAFDTVAYGLSEPWYLGIDPAGTAAYVAEADSGEISKVDLLTGVVTVVAQGLSGPHGLVLRCDLCLADTTCNDGNACTLDACSQGTCVNTPLGPDSDGDSIRDACDTCTDTDRDGFGDPGFPANTCPLDNCPGVANSTQANADGDGFGDACDPCPGDPANRCIPAVPAVSEWGTMGLILLLLTTAMMIIRRTPRGRRNER